MKLLLLLSVLFSVNTYAQKIHILEDIVAVGDRTKPEEGAAFVVQSTTRASLPCPKMSSAQRDALGITPVGACVFNTSSGATEFYDGIAWLASSASSGGLQKWISTTPYAVDATIFEPLTNKIYKAVVAHVSGATFAADIANWEELSDDLNRLGSSTDQAVVVFDGTSGDVVQESPLIVDTANGNTTGMGSLTMSDALTGVTSITMDGDLTGADAITMDGDLTGADNVVMGGALTGVTDLTMSGTATIGTLAGPLRAAAGVVSAGAVDAATEISGILPIANGGTNSSAALTNDNVMYSQGGEIVESPLVLDSSGNLSGIADLTLIGTTTLDTTLTGPLRANLGVVSTGNTDLTSEVDNVLPIANGGSNSSAALANGKAMHSLGGAIVESAVDIDAVGNVSSINNLGVNGTTTLNNGLNGVLRANAGVVSTGNVDLTNDVTNVLPIANGGTNSSSALFNSLIMYSQGDAIVESPVGLSNTGNITNLGSIGMSGAITGTTNLTMTGSISGAINLEATGLSNLGNLRIQANTISAQNLNGDISLVPDGTGIVSSSGDLLLGDNSSITLNETALNGSDGVEISALPSLAASYSLTLPPNDGNAGDKLTTDGSGVLTWTVDDNDGNLLTTKGELLSHNGTSPQIIGLGTQDQILTVDLLEPTGLAFRDAPISTTVSAQGDIQTHDGTDNATLPVGNDGEFIVADSTDPLGIKWSNTLQGKLNPVTDYTTFPCSGSWTTNTTYTCFSKQVGDELKIRGKVELTGAPNAATFSVNLPTGFTIDMTKLTEATTSAQLVGKFQAFSGAVSFFGVATAIVGDTTLVSFRELADNGTNEQLAIINQNSPFTFGNGDEITFEFSVPVNELSSGVSAVVQNQKLVEVEARGNSGGTLTANVTLIPFVNEITDNTNSFSGTEFTAPVSSLYDFNGSVNFGSSTGGTVELYIDGVYVQRCSDSSASSFRKFGCRYKMNAGQVASFRFDVTIALGTVENSERHYINIIQENTNPIASATISQASLERNLDVYSETEVVWGVWNGDTLYRRCFTVASDISSGTTVVTTFASGLQPRGIGSFTGDIYIFFRTISGSNSSDIRYLKSTGQIQANVGGTYIIDAGTSFCMDYTK